jgi:hypothetical protein
MTLLLIDFSETFPEIISRRYPSNSGVNGDTFREVESQVVFQLQYRWAAALPHVEDLKLQVGKAV